MTVGSLLGCEWNDSAALAARGAAGFMSPEVATLLELGSGAGEEHDPE
jgi:hypothetical protein